MSTAAATYRTAIERVIRACLDRLDDPGLDLAALAAEAGYSPFHFHRLFAAMTGESPSALIRRLRLERAATTLTGSKQPVGVVGLEAGYSTPDAFARAFRQAFGVLPSEFRRRGYDPMIQSPNHVHYGREVAVRFLAYGEIEMKTTIEERPALHVVGLRHKGAYWTIGRTFGELAQWAATHGVPMETAVAVYYDDPAKTPEAELRSDALLVVAQPATAAEGMVAYTIPSGRYCVGLHEGAYEGLGHAWQVLFGEEIPKSGATMREGYCYELYLNDCTKVAPEDLRTEILAPVA